MVGGIPAAQPEPTGSEWYKTDRIQIIITLFDEGVKYIK